MLAAALPTQERPWRAHADFACAHVRQRTMPLGTEQENAVLAPNGDRWREGEGRKALLDSQCTEASAGRSTYRGGIGRTTTRDDRDGCAQPQDRYGFGRPTTTSL
eukprot:745264-Pleurochrysis_carterae.AAC.1